ncbi:hypothetical protein [Agromyces salentinus]|uniref:Multidrug transporter n=1 Tax=Agromyces salentinus TaxID=269421 RepID=A0ABN2MLZ6_9MICO|nr:hypothetical protein [Agromyces salentinus]
MSDTSTNAAAPTDNRAEEDRANLPMTQVDEEEVASHRGTAQAPEGQGVGIAGESSPLPDEDADPAVERGID